MAMRRHIWIERLRNDIGVRKRTWVLNMICLSIAFAVMFIVLKQVKYDLSFNAGYPQAEAVRCAEERKGI